MTRDELIYKFVQDYDIEVPADLIENEYRLCLADMRHRIVYSQMAGENIYCSGLILEMPESMKKELWEEACHIAKESIVYADILKRNSFTVSFEEKLEKAKEIACTQNTDLDFVRSFFGDDFSLLEGDIKRRKVEDWICETASEQI